MCGRVEASRWHDGEKTGFSVNPSSLHAAENTGSEMRTAFVLLSQPERAACAVRQFSSNNIPLKALTLVVPHASPEWRMRRIVLHQLRLPWAIGELCLPVLQRRVGEVASTCSALLPD